MTARPQPVPENGTRVKWSLKPGTLPNATTMLEVEEAASDNFGQQDGFRSYWFSSYTLARGFIRRVAREIPEVDASVIV